VADILADESVNVGFPKAFGLRASLTIPLVVRDEVVGCLLLYSATQPRAFSDVELDFGKKLGAAVSLALETARLYQAEHQVTKKLQDAMLRVPDSAEGVRFAHEYHSSSQLARIGGDFYDVFDVDESILGILIGDIAGKGIDAGVIAAQVKTMIHARATESDRVLSEVLAATNAQLLRETEPQVFATVFLAYLDRRSGRLTFCSAGHTTGAVIHPDGSLELLRANSPVIGAVPDVTFTDSETSIEGGDRIFLYTDGLVEARAAEGIFGERRMWTAVLSEPGAGIEQMASCAVRAAMDFHGGPLDDDAAVLVIEYLGDAAG